jgi:hypothetical protein
MPVLRMPHPDAEARGGLSHSSSLGMPPSSTAGAPFRVSLVRHSVGVACLCGVCRVDSVRGPRARLCLHHVQQQEEIETQIQNGQKAVIDEAVRLAGQGDARGLLGVLIKFVGVANEETQRTREQLKMSEATSRKLNDELTAALAREARLQEELRGGGGRTPPSQPTSLEIASRLSQRPSSRPSSLEDLAGGGHLVHVGLPRAPTSVGSE